MSKTITPTLLQMLTAAADTYDHEARPAILNGQSTGDTLAEFIHHELIGDFDLLPLTNAKRRKLDQDNVACAIQRIRTALSELEDVAEALETFQKEHFPTK